MSAVEMRMPRRMSVMAREGIIRNEYIRCSLDVASLVDKMREIRQRWFAHAHGEKIMKNGKRWLDVIENDLRTAGVCEVLDRAKWKFRTKVIDLK
ncbi:Hypothetical protein CINCED_3A015722 [Cinara cedri]|uniref:Uncharacterized protein n=1 Tax=Cinara cedri TaxID=506608 RepID=A0A5E4M7E1_9HEMI|nr:Hypothetical protein CINCED_3A015722 [Cinara cedri]